MAKTATGVEIEPIDRLEEKLKALVGIVDRLKTEQAQAAAENTALKAEVESLRGRVAAGETLSTELSALREERDLIRSRVGEMLQQLDALEL
jgi:regulator of replication initiation timing